MMMPHLQSSIKQLTAAGFDEHTAEQLTCLLDGCIRNYTTALLRRLPSRTSYDEQLANASFRLSKLRDEAISTEAAHSATLRADYEALAAGIGRLRTEMTEQTTSSEQTLRLDINLERQRTSEAYRDLERRVVEAVTRGTEQMDKVRTDMQSESRKAVKGLGALFGIVMLIIMVVPVGATRR